MQKPYIRKFIFVSSLASLLLAIAFWLSAPGDDKAWRSNLTLPVFGKTSIRVYPALQIITSLPGRYLLANTHWSTRYGILQLRNNLGRLQVVCEPCRFHIPEISEQPLRFAKFSLTGQIIEDQLSGNIEIQQASNQVKLQFTGSLSMQGLSLNWSLPKTPINKLVAMLRTQSSVLESAKANGTLNVAGTLHWPSRVWSAVPELNGLTVTGLGTERLKTPEIIYRCPTTQGNIKPMPYHWINENKMGRWLPRAVIIAEDAHFKEHPGYNLSAIRSIMAQENRNKQLGGSTITQQLAKNFFTGGAHTWLRKLEELLYAVEMENTLGKRRILALYLNTVDWGPGICGVAQAANIYFSRMPSQLTPIQASWLASIIRNPHRAWHKEYLTKMPDEHRLAWVMAYMPKKAKNTSSLLGIGELFVRKHDDVKKVKIRV